MAMTYCIRGMLYGKMALLIAETAHEKVCEMRRDFMKRRFQDFGNIYHFIAMLRFITNCPDLGNVESSATTEMAAGFRTSGLGKN